MGKRVTIIGAGITGLFCAKRLNRLGIKTINYDKGRNIGGKFCSRHIEGGLFHHGAASFPDFFKYKNFAPFGFEVLSEALKTGKILYKNDGFIPFHSVSNFINFLAKDTKVDCNTELIELDIKEKALSLKDKNGSIKKVSYDMLVLALPNHQVIKILNKQVPAIKKILEHTSMRPSASAMVAFDLEPDKDQLGIIEGENIHAFLENSRFSFQSSKTCWTIHSKKSLGVELANNTKDEISDILFEEFNKIFLGKLPTPYYKKGHRWLYGFTQEPLKKSHLLFREFDLGVCGDWCLGETMLDAVNSGIKMAEEIRGNT
jgi:hypothetical protein